MIRQLNKTITRKAFLIIILFILLTPLYSIYSEAADYQGINITDQTRILKTLSSNIFDFWMDSVVDNTGANNELALSIVRQAVLNDLKNYLLIEAPQEVVLEIAQTISKLSNLFISPDIKSIISTIEGSTVKESVKYLISWLNDNEIKTGMGDLSNSYIDLTGKDSKADFQYVILYEPKTDEIGLVSVKIYSSKSINPPKSSGSIAGTWGTAWNYTEAHEKGQKIPPFIVSISGRMKKDKAGYWQDDITHKYSWVGKPKIEVEFPKDVEHFKFKKKGFFQKTKDKINNLFNQTKNSINKFKGLFDKLKNSFSASLVNPPVDKNQKIQEIVNDLADLFNKIEEKVPEDEFKEIEKEIEEAETEEDLQKLLLKLKDLEIDLKLLEFLISGLEEIKPALEPEKSYPQLLINEVCVGFYGAKNEFVELYNPTKEDILLDDLILELVDSSNKPTNKQITWTNTTIPAESYFLFTAGELKYGNKTLIPDATFSSQLSGSSGVIIKNSEDHVYDKVSFGSRDKTPPALAIETRGKMLSSGLKTGQSLERLRNEDTDNNWDDFYHKLAPSPTNSKGDKFKYSYGGGSTSSSSGSSSSDTASLCSSSDASNPTYTPIIINEVAWMGSLNSYTDEWIELRNLTDSAISLENWELFINDDYIKFDASDNIEANDYFLMERTDDDSAPNITADHIYSGSLNNSDVDLKLFNNSCEIIDRVTANPDWAAGDNDTKRTMERDHELNWHNYYGDGDNNILGTPKAENSQEVVTQGDMPDEDEEEIVNENVIITEVRSTDNYEFVELYNPLDDFIDAQNLYLAYYSSDRDWNDPFLNQQFEALFIESKDYYLIGFGDYPGEGDPDHDWKPYQSHISDDAGAIGIFNCDVTTKETPEAALECKIDALGWGETIVKEGDSVINGENSMARLITVDESGYLMYQDTNNNSNDFELQDSTPNTINNHGYSDLDGDGIVDSLDPETIITQDITLAAGEYTFKNFIINSDVTVTALSDSSLEGFKGVKLIAENITLNSNSYLTADYNGYESGFGPGICKTDDSVGGTYGGLGGRCEDTTKVYGDLFNPIDLGSGSSKIENRRGGSGGGAIALEVSGVFSLDGTLSSNGEDGLGYGGWGYPATGAGSGGSLYIACDSFSGSGVIRSNGGHVESSAGGGSGGRISLNYANSNFTGSVQSYGGQNTDNDNYNGGPGSIYQQGVLTFDNNNISGDSVLSGDNLVFETISIKNASNIYLFDNITSGLFEINNGSIETIDDIDLNLSGNITLNQSQFTSSMLKILTIAAQDILLGDSTITANTQIQANNLTIDSSSNMTSLALGDAGEEGLGAGINSWGGSYGGLGGRNYEGSGYGQPYGDATNPQAFGSGGGNATATKLGANGGGKHQINITNNLTIEGNFNSNGGDGSSSNPTAGAGSGGSINITTGYLLGSGTIESNGGKAYSSAGAGGGGRVKLVGDQASFTGQIQSLGGVHDSNVNYNGGDGSIQ